jgi:hypothetical protein
MKYIQRLWRPAAAEFYRDFVIPQRPVLLGGMVSEWPAVSRWKPHYLKEVFGDSQIQVMAGRDADPRYEPNCEAHRQMMPASWYIEHAFNGRGNDTYLVANNKLMETQAGRTLLGDVIQWPGFLEPLHPCRAGGNVFLWFGPKGTVTPLHHDIPDILLCQVIGAKRMAMIAPSQKPYLYNSVGVYSDVDYEAPDLMKFPMFAAAEALEFTLMPGDALFIPAQWWHFVKSLSASMSVSFTNFVRQ